MAKCSLCGKKAVVQKRSMHRRGVASAKFRRRAKKVSKTYRPNIQKITIKVGEVKLSGKFCTKCVKAMKKKKKKTTETKTKTKK